MAIRAGISFPSLSVPDYQVIKSNQTKNTEFLDFTAFVPLRKRVRFPFQTVLSNRCRYFGSAELLDSDTLGEIGKQLGDDYVVLPSSVHECIILPLEDAPPYEELAGMVRAVNREQVDIQDRLSDHVYRYDRSRGKLEIAV